MLCLTCLLVKIILIDKGLQYNYLADLFVIHIEQEQSQYTRQWVLLSGLISSINTIHFKQDPLRYACAKFHEH